MSKVAKLSAAREMARSLIRESIVEDAMCHFLAQTMQHVSATHISREKHQADLEAAVLRALEWAAVIARDYDKQHANMAVSFNTASSIFARIRAATPDQIAAIVKGE